MYWIEWLSLAGICALGAMTPGPSLLIVLRSASAGLYQGLASAIAHGLGIGIYALLTALGLAVVITQTPMLFNGLQWAGALFLAYLGVQALRHAGAPQPGESQSKQASTASLSVGKAALQGFGIAFFNPKVALFFGALFSQFVSNEQALATKISMAVLAATIDTAWYLIVALVVIYGSRRGLTTGSWRPWLQRIFGVLLIGLALRLLWSL
ncbi:LysE family translocator [Microbulbifer celer]|uniref:LysE family translocator n=1 Tax=Microbulbifer celer TaxID=435905 RepID=A0ABW3U7F6_9GAMM|nr:LysE family translocator [Microbulbifer celer]UFN58622.1 LysE family translocator [Microbulbifer celer]